MSADGQRAPGPALSTARRLSSAGGFSENAQPGGASRAGRPIPVPNLEKERRLCRSRTNTSRV
jgi:hypothetical protein